MTVAATAASVHNSVMGWSLRNGYNSLVALTNAERQRRYRERRAAGEPVREPPPRPRAPRPKPRPARWAAAVAELRTLQAQYETWRDNLPEALAGSRTAELLDEVCDVDLDAVDVELPRGFGRD